MDPNQYGSQPEIGFPPGNTISSQPTYPSLETAVNNVRERGYDVGEELRPTGRQMLSHGRQWVGTLSGVNQPRLPGPQGAEIGDPS